jgi:hypothetical protein
MSDCGRELPNDTVLLVTGCFQYRLTDAPDPKQPVRDIESGHSGTLKVRSGHEQNVGIVTTAALQHLVFAQL